MRNLEPRRVRWMRVRLAVLTLLLVGAAVAVVHRAYRLQILESAELRAMAEEQYLKNIRLAPKRGTIFDRNGAELAVSVDVESVWVNPIAIQGVNAVERVAREISPVLGLDELGVVELLRQRRRFRWLRRRLSPQQAQNVRRLGLPGVGLESESRRFYPNRELASHVLGFANVDGLGVEGVERALEDELRGSRSSVRAIQDASRRIVFSDGLLDDRTTAGHDVTLTIDRAIQHVAERELAMAVRTYEARAASIVVIAPATGDILALANVPTFNPNEPGLADVSARRDRAVTDRFEPGSTLKVFTVAGALARGSIGADQPIYCERGAMEVDEENTIHDTHVYEWLTPAQILMRSSNIGASKIGRALGRRNLYRALRAFGFGERTGVSLTGEVAGNLRHWRRWFAMDAATIPFGQGMSVTALQLALATAAMANGGRLMYPRLVRRVSNSRGETVREVRPEVRRRVVPDTITRLVGDMMTAVTGPGGTGTEAAIEGYLVAGKTGTAQKADDVAGGYHDERFTSSFIGFVPADRPVLAIAVVVDEPALARAGGAVAGPVFRRVAAEALRHLGVPADGGGSAIAAHTATPPPAEMPVEPVGAEADEALDEETDGAGDDAPGDDAVVAAQPLPTPPQPGEGEVRVPPLLGKSIRAALRAGREAELEIDPIGSGVVTSTSPEAGVIVRRGSRVRIALEPPREDNPAQPDDEPEPEPDPDRSASTQPGEPTARDQRLAGRSEDPP